MKLYFALFTMFFILISCSKADDESVQQQPPFVIKAVDGSFIPQVRLSGMVTKNSAGQPEDMLTTLKSSGVNTIRIRLWKDPADGHSGFNEVKQFAQEVRNSGMKVWLTVHYSDTWADPGNQQPPAAWVGQSYEQLKTSVYNYTKQIVTGINPDYIQIGNEINKGFLWPQGSYTNPTQLAGLLQEGIRAVREESETAKIMIHYAGHEEAATFYSNFTTLDYDIIALSYYPTWHGHHLNALQDNINSLAMEFDKDVVIAETSYPFTLGWNDWTNNVIGSNDQILPQYPATPQGQKEYLAKIREIATNSPRAIGFCYWGGEWISFNGSEATNGSSYENQALWDFNNQALPATQVFLN